MSAETIFYGGRSIAELGSVSTALSNVAGQSGQTSLLVTGNAVVSNTLTAANLITNNIVMSSNMTSGTGFGNVYFTGNLVVSGNLFSSGGSVGSGSGTSQGFLLSLGAGGYTLPTAFSVGSAGPTMNGYHINMASFTAEAAQAVTIFSVSTGLLKFTTAGLYQLTCVVVADQPVAKVAVGKTTTYTTWAALQASGLGATTGYDYVYNYPVGSSPSEVVTIPITVTDTTQYYYLDVFLSTAAGNPTTLYPTRSTTAAGSAFGTYIQVAPFGNYLTSATSVAAALLANCSASSNLSGVYSSNAYRIALTTANGWTVNGTSTSLAVTSNGNFQVNQVGIYEVNLCLNTVGATAAQFQVGSLANDTLSPAGTGAYYLYTYAPMYTQDPTTAIKLPVNITSVSNVYFVECSFPGTLTGNVALSATSTFVSIKPIGGYINSGTNPWTQQGTSVYYNGGNVGIGGAVPTALTETLTVNGNTSFVGNVTVTTDASSNTYVNARRTPAGSLAVSNYVTGSVPLTTTTNLIQNYLANAATIRSNTSTGTITQALYIPGTTTSSVNFSTGQSICLSNLALSNIFLETWVYVGLGASQCVFARQVPGSNTQLNMFIDASGIVTATFANATTGVSASNATPITGSAWWHLATSYQRLTNTTGTVRLYINGGKSTDVSFGSATGTQPLIVPGTTAFYIGNAPNGGAALNGNVADFRVMTNCIVPTATFTPQSAPFTSGPTYITGMDTGYTSNLTLALNSQYFPGASTSPYGPCLTLPGTLGSYYSQTSTSAINTQWNTNGFCLEAWVNYASLANSNTYLNSSSYSYMIQRGNAPVSGGDFAFGVNTNGAVSINWSYSGGNQGVATPAAAITTGQWTHIMAQCNGSNVYVAVNGVFQALTGQNYTPTNGNGTIAPASPSSIIAPASYPLSVGQWGGQTGPNFAIAKARLVFGTTGTNGNVYSSGTFSPSPNFNPTLPSGATIAWQLDSQYPLPTFPSIQDVTPLPSQLTSYGAVPTVVGGVTSNISGPYPSTYPQLDSLRFDGTGYIDYGNAASSALTTNLWANAWTIEAWVYPTNLVANYPNIISRSNAATSDWYLNLAQTTGVVGFKSGAITGGSTDNVGVLTAPLNTWTHVAATYDGTRSNVYVGGALSNSMVASAMLQTFTPTLSTAVGYTAGQYMYGNLADLRVSNVARYTGSSYTVPTAPFVNDSNTILLLKSLGGQVGTTLEVQGRGLNSVSLGAGRVVQSYPPAPMSSYLLDTTSNALVTYGQGKYIASASAERTNNNAWMAFNYVVAQNGGEYQTPATSYASNTGGPGAYLGSVSTVDVLGNSYAGEWLQIQMPVSVLLSSYTINNVNMNYNPYTWWVLGSRDGINWTLVDSRASIGAVWNSVSGYRSLTFTVGATQAYNYYRMVLNAIFSNGTGNTALGIGEWILNGTEEGLVLTNDSKVGVGIANPQRSLEVAGDLVVGGTISGGAGMGAFRNRIINGDMRIAQRGVGPATIGVAAYLMVDRCSQYASGPGTVSVAQRLLTASDTPWQLGFMNSYSITVLSGGTGSTVDSSPMAQHIEGYNIADLKWGTPFGQPVTVSFWLRTNLPTGSIMNFVLSGGATYSYLSTISTLGSNIWQYVTSTIPPPPNGSTWNVTTGRALSLNMFYYNSYGTYSNSSPNTWLGGNYVTYTGSYNWVQTTGNYIEFTGLQLEKGTVATPFEFRPYATELALCQRYFTQLGGQMGNNYFGTGLASSATNAYILCPLPVVMRAPASSTVAVINVASISLLGNVSGVYGTTTLSALAKDQHNINNIQLVATTTNMTTNFPYMMYQSGANTPFIQINNEL